MHLRVVVNEHAVVERGDVDVGRVEHVEDPEQREPRTHVQICCVRCGHCWSHVRLGWGLEHCDLCRKTTYGHARGVGGPSRAMPMVSRCGKRAPMLSWLRARTSAEHVAATSTPPHAAPTDSGGQCSTAGMPMGGTVSGRSPGTVSG